MGLIVFRKEYAVEKPRYGKLQSLLEGKGKKRANQESQARIISYPQPPPPPAPRYS